MTYVYEYSEDSQHQHCHKIEVTTGEDLRLGRRAYIDQRCEECKAEIDETDHLRAEIKRLRKRNNYLREELNATDYRKRELLEEVNRLRALIVEWADAAQERAAHLRSGLSDSGQRHYDACEALAAEA